MGNKNKLRLNDGSYLETDLEIERYEIAQDFLVLMKKVCKNFEPLGISAAWLTVAYPYLKKNDEGMYIINMDFIKKDNPSYVTIRDNKLGIVVTGKTKEEADQNYIEEVSFLHERLNSMTDKELGKSLLKTKAAVNELMKEKQFAGK